MLPDGRGRVVSGGTERIRGEQPIGDGCEEFLTWLQVERGRSANTLAAYRHDLRAYVEWLSSRNTTLDAVSETDLQRYVSALRDGGAAPASVKRATVVVTSMHRFLVDEGFAPADPTANVEVPRVPQSIPKALSVEQVTMLLNSIGGDHPVALRDRAILEVLYAGGLRVGELVGLSLGDLMLGDQMLRAYGKGSKERMVPIGRFALAALSDWLSPAGRGAMVPKKWRSRAHAEAVFLNQRGGRLTRQGAWLVIQGRAEAVGMGELVHPHVFRHSCATHLVEGGADLRSVQELLGHASLTTTQVYTKVAPERLRAVYDDAHPRARSGR